LIQPRARRDPPQPVKRSDLRGAVRVIPAALPAVFSKLDGLRRFLAPLLPAPQAA